ncbi:RNA-binding protein Jag, partial [hydrothermal vent metagenome]
TDAPDDGGAAAPMAVTGLVEQAQPATEPAEPATEQAQPATEPEAKQVEPATEQAQPATEPAEPATEQAQPATEPEAKQVEPATEQAQPAEEKAALADQPDSGDEVVTFESKYRPWVAEGASGICIPKQGKGYGGKLYDPRPLSDPQEVKKESRRPDEAGYRAQERGGHEEEEFIPTVYEEDENSTITEDVKRMAMDFVGHTVKSMGLGDQITGYRLADRLLIQIDSESAGLLIGHRGETLEALQYLTDIIVNRHLEHRVRIILDTENYRDKRKFKICQMAKRAAVDASMTRKSVALSPMNPGERRLVHTSLAGDSKVKTMSEGDGSRRRVVIHPVGGKKGDFKPKPGNRKRKW